MPKPFRYVLFLSLAIAFVPGNAPATESAGRGTPAGAPILAMDGGNAKGLQEQTSP